MEFLPSIIILGLLALIAWRLAYARQLQADDAPARKAAAMFLLVATLVQAAHFIEEATTGFHAAFPAFFGQPPIPLAAFVSFNVTWLLIWLASVPGTYSANRFALFAAWFLALAGMLNGIAHPLLAAAVGGYFPGLVTSPFIGIAGLLLWQRLRRATRLQESATTA